MHWICSSNIVMWYLAYILSGFAENKEILKSPIGEITLQSEAVAEMCSMKNV